MVDWFAHCEKSDKLSHLKLEERHRRMQNCRERYTFMLELTFRKIPATDDDYRVELSTKASHQAKQMVIWFAYCKKSDKLSHLDSVKWHRRIKNCHDRFAFMLELKFKKTRATTLVVRRAIVVKRCRRSIRTTDKRSGHRERLRDKEHCWTNSLAPGRNSAHGEEPRERSKRPSRGN